MCCGRITPILLRQLYINAPYTQFCSSECKNSSPRPWRKVLYEDQGVSDNYVHSSFLTEMKKNLFVRKYRYWWLVLNTGCISQQVNAVAILIMCYIYLQDRIIDHQVLNCVSAAVLFLGYLFTTVTDYPVREIKALIIFCTASFVLSPVLMSLTETISTDTIYAMTVVMLLIHLITHNYQPSSSDAVISFNAGIFATVCLASRLAQLAQGYAFIVVSVLIFGFLPNLRRYLRTYSKPYVDVTLTFSFFILAFTMVWMQNVTIAIMLGFVFLFIMFLCPYLLINLLPLKNNVYGPWDEAVVAEH